MSLPGLGAYPWGSPWSVSRLHLLWSPSPLWKTSDPYLATPKMRRTKRTSSKPMQHLKILFLLSSEVFSNNQCSFDREAPRARQPDQSGLWTFGCEVQASPLSSTLAWLTLASPVLEHAMHFYTSPALARYFSVFMSFSMASVYFSTWKTPVSIPCSNLSSSLSLPFPPGRAESSSLLAATRLIWFEHSLTPKSKIWTIFNADVTPQVENSVPDFVCWAPFKMLVY